jgi:hypothetical protein
MNHWLRSLSLLAFSVSTLLCAEWSAPVEVQHELKPVVTYKAKVEGDLLIINAKVEPGWHTFTIDNEKRAAEKLAGKKSLGIDQPTMFKLDSNLELAGPWHQSQPKDFSKPQLRWYSFGFEKEVTFAAKVQRKGAGPAQIGVRGQACSDTTCKNIDVTISVPLSGSPQETASIKLENLVPVK